MRKTAQLGSRSSKALDIRSAELWTSEAQRTARRRVYLYDLYQMWGGHFICPWTIMCRVHSRRKAIQEQMAHAEIGSPQPWSPEEQSPGPDTRRSPSDPLLRIIFVSQLEVATNSPPGPRKYSCPAFRPGRSHIRDWRVANRYGESSSSTRPFVSMAKSMVTRAPTIRMPAKAAKTY